MTKYKVIGRDYWCSDLQHRFGKNGSIHDMSDADIVDAIKKFGRAQIIENTENGIAILEFHNDQDF